MSTKLHIEDERFFMNDANGKFWNSAQNNFMEISEDRIENFSIPMIRQNYTLFFQIKNWFDAHNINIGYPNILTGYTSVEPLIRRFKLKNMRLIYGEKASIPSFFFDGLSISNEFIEKMKKNLFILIPELAYNINQTENIYDYKFVEKIVRDNEHLLTTKTKILRLRESETSIVARFFVGLNSEKDAAMLMLSGVRLFKTSELFKIEE